MSKVYKEKSKENYLPKRKYIYLKKRRNFEFFNFNYKIFS